MLTYFPFSEKLFFAFANIFKYLKPCGGPSALVGFLNSGRRLAKQEQKYRNVISQKYIDTRISTYIFTNTNTRTQNNLDVEKFQKRKQKCKRGEGQNAGLLGLGSSSGLIFHFQNDSERQSWGGAEIPEKILVLGKY